MQGRLNLRRATLEITRALDPRPIERTFPFGGDASDKRPTINPAVAPTGGP
jgi:hypothetical protein